MFRATLRRAASALQTSATSSATLYGQRPHPGHRPDAGLSRLGLVRGHQRAAARVAQQHHLPGPGLFAQPAHPDADLGQRVVQEEVRLAAAEPGVPAEEPEASFGHEAGQVVLGKVHVVVGGDERHPRPAGRRAVVDALARVTARARPGPETHYRRRQPDELPHDLAHSPLPIPASWRGTALAPAAPAPWRGTETEFRFRFDR